MRTLFSASKHSFFSLAVTMIAMAVAFECAAETQADPDRPNVVLIYADDMGYGEVQALNPERYKVPTPHLDRLISQGRIFTDAHTSSSVCTPSRYALLTGRYNWRTRLQSGVATVDDEPLIAPDRLTLGRFFQKQGYRTAIVGKWHLDYHHKRPEHLVDAPVNKRTKTLYPAPHPIGTIIPDGPIIRGFDTFFGFHHSRIMSSLVRDDRIVEEIDVVDVLPRLTEEATAWIAAEAERSKSGQPFFFYFPLSSPHTPIVPAEAWAGNTEIGKYGDFVAQTDASVGAIMDALDQHGFDDNTILIFSSDNGTSKQADIESMQSKGHFPTADLRGSKADLWEGGHRVPLIVRWPGWVEAGTESSQLVCLSDMLATFADYFAFQLPDDAGEDSMSFLAALLGESSQQPRQSIVHHSISGHFAIREGDWKLLLAPGSGGWSSPRGEQALKEGLPPMQLYNLGSDRSEQNNLQAEQPEKIRALLDLLDNIVAQGRSTPGEPQPNDAPIELWKTTPGTP